MVAVPNDSAIGFEIHLVALQTAGNGDASFRRYEGLIKNLGGTTSIVGVVTEFIVSEDSPFISVTVSASGNNLRVNVTETSGASGINVSAFVRFTQTLF